MSLKPLVSQADPDKAAEAEVMSQSVVQELLCRRVPDDDKMAEARLTLSLRRPEVSSARDLKGVAAGAEDTEVAVAREMGRAVVQSSNGCRPCCW